MLIPSKKETGDKVNSSLEISREIHNYARSRCVRVRNVFRKIARFGDPTEKIATGVIIKTGLVLTNYHVVQEEGKITVNKHPAELVYHDVRYDLAALKTKTRRLRYTRIDLRKKSEQTQRVFYIGNSNGFTKSIAPGFITWVNRVEFHFSISSAEGSSGSGIYDRLDKKLIGILDSGYLNEDVVIPAPVIRAFLVEVLPRFDRIR